MSSKLITVFGATGTQGGSVIQSLLQNKTQHITLRAITRNDKSEKSQRLLSNGVEVVKADIFDRDDVATAVKGSWGLFLNISSDDPNILEAGGDVELIAGKCIIDLAYEAGVKHIVYSTLISATETSKGTFPRCDFDTKHATFEYAKAKGFESVVGVSAGWFYENHLAEDFAPVFGGFPFTADDDNYLTFTMPRWGGEKDEIPWVSITDDFGDFVHAIFLEPLKYNHQFIQAFSYKAPPDELVETFAKITGKKARYLPGKVSDLEKLHKQTHGVIGYLVHTKNNYYGSPNNLEMATKLKAIAAEAKGQDKSSDEAQLMSLEKFVSRYFS